MSKPLKIIIFLTCTIVMIYFGILIRKQLMPSYKDQYMHCLELGSNYRTQKCLQLIK